jgi:hypothetical protein
MRRIKYVLSITFLVLISGCALDSNRVPQPVLADSLYRIPVEMRNYAVAQRGTEVMFEYEYDARRKFGIHEWFSSPFEFGTIRMDYNNQALNCGGRFILWVREIDGEPRAVYLATGLNYTYATDRDTELWQTGSLAYDDAQELARHIDDEPTLRRDTYVRASVDRVQIDYSPLIDAVAFFDSIRVESRAATQRGDVCSRLVTLNTLWPGTEPGEGQF